VAGAATLVGVVGTRVGTKVSTRSARRRDLAVVARFTGGGRAEGMTVAGGEEAGGGG